MNERLESSHFPYLPLRVDVRGRAYEVDALIDTGFDGDVTLPVSLLGNGAPDSPSFSWLWATNQASAGE